MNISFDCYIDDSIIDNKKGTHNDSFCIEDETLNEYDIINNISAQINRDNNNNSILNNNNSNPFLAYHYKVNDFINDDLQNPEHLYFQTFSNNNIPLSNINKDTNLTELNADKSKVKQIFEIKKESLPKFFTENSINIIIRQQYDINKELKSKLLLDINTNNMDIEQIKRVLESDTKKRRKTYKNSLYRTDHILIKLINIINLSLSNFINNLIAAFYSKEKIYHILNGLISSNKIKDYDLKKVIKMNAYIFRSKLETREEKLNLLNLTLRKYFSNKISSKYKKLKESSNYNELIIEKLLIDDDNKDTFDFILNDLLIKDWLEILLYKKTLSSI